MNTSGAATVEVHVAAAVVPEAFATDATRPVTIMGLRPVAIATYRLATRPGRPRPAAAMVAVHTAFGAVGARPIATRTRQVRAREAPVGILAGHVPNGTEEGQVVACHSR